MQESAGLIVATPIYFAGGITAQTTAWHDRIFPCIGMDLSPKMPAKPVPFIFIQNLPDTRLSGIPTTTFIPMIGLTGLSVKDLMIAGNPDAGRTPPVEGRGDLMEQAYRRGKNLL